MRTLDREPHLFSATLGPAEKALLICGIFGALLYTAMVVFIPAHWDGYSSASQTVSELSAIGAPTRTTWIALGKVYGLLTLAFGLGVWLSAARSRRLRVVGGALIVQSIINLSWPPMHLRGVVPTLTDTLHIAFAMAWLFLMLLGMGVAAAAFGRWFRLYSGAVLAVFVVFGALSGIEAPRIAANLPTPWIGVWERINIGASMSWVIVLAIMLLRRPKSPHTGPRGSRQISHATLVGAS